MARTLCRLSALPLLATALAPAWGADAAREPLPRLVGDTRRIECTDALALARASFFGTTFGLHMPSTAPAAMLQGHFVLDDRTFNEDPPPAVDLAFERMADPASTWDVTLWERGDAVPWRWVATRNEYSWRGPTFGLYAVNSTTSKEAFLANRRDVADSRPTVDASVTTIFEGLLQPPYVLRSPRDGTLWALDGGRPWVALAGWKIFVRGDSGPLSPCSISFGLDESQQAVSLLPPDLAKLEALLLDALGPGMGEGTLHPTERIRGDVQRTWANIALRPWSLPQPYNTREEVEAGLVEWAEQDADQRAELARIHALVPRSERALAAYYRSAFGLSRKQAQRSAMHAIDVAVRMHFVFHSERAHAAESASPEPNPWPAGVYQQRSPRIDARH